MRKCDCSSECLLRFNEDKPLVKEVCKCGNPGEDDVDCCTGCGTGALGETDNGDFDNPYVAWNCF